METVKNKGGRPRIAESMKVMNNSRSARVHNDIAKLVRRLNVAFRAGKISYSDIEGLLNKRNL